MMVRMILVLLVAVTCGIAQTIPADREQLLKGEGMGQASYGEMNGYPGPKHVMELKSELNLNPDQIKKAEVITAGVSNTATIKGEEIVEAEEDLNNAFKSGMLNEKQLRAKLERIGKLRADLRFVHLQAHLKMKQILTANQIAKYNELRGHGADSTGVHLHQ